jgi:hypothetical protein
MRKRQWILDSFLENPTTACLNEIFWLLEVFDFADFRSDAVDFGAN